MFLVLLFAGLLQSGQPLLRSGDRVAILGGTMVERMQDSGTFEAELQTRRPDWHLSFRNLGWSGDNVHGVARKRFDGPEDGYQRILADVRTADPTVVLVAYGFSDAGNGSSAVDRFEAGLVRLIGDLRADNRRVILVSPFAMPGYQSDGYAPAVERTRLILGAVAKQTDVPEIAIDWRPSAGEVSENGLVLNSVGYGKLASELSGPLLGEPSGRSDSPSEQLSARVVEKDNLFFHRFRPQNETYLMLFRKHEQGNNAAEIPLFDPLVRAADEKIWKTAFESATVR